MTTARRYHDETKHFPGRPSSNPYGLEWRNEPDLFKRYSGIEPEPVPEELARLLCLGAGVHPGRRDPHFRTFMSAGALHPLELYAATELGLAHFHPGEGMVRRLRTEDVRAALARAAAAAPELAEAAAVLVLTGIVWRTAWKYGARGWRHVFWDAGAMLANLLALAEEAELHPRLFTAFVDAEVARVLGVEPPREAPVALLVLGHAGRASLGPLPTLRHGVLRLSPREHRFREAEEAQAASELATEDEVRAWREYAARFSKRRDDGQPPAQLDRVILRRGSAREFTPDSIEREELAAALRWACAEVPVDLPRLCSTVVIAHAIEGLAPAAYLFDPPDRFEPVREGASRRETAHLCLDQPLGGDAAATIFFTADLDRVLSALGDRGYRAAQLDAGIGAGRLSLGAYARGLGATGLTFYDEEVREFLRTAEEPMMCVAVGLDARRPLLRPQRRR